MVLLHHLPHILGLDLVLLHQDVHLADLLLDVGLDLLDQEGPHLGVVHGDVVHHHGEAGPHLRQALIGPVQLVCRGQSGLTLSLGEILQYSIFVMKDYWNNKLWIITVV